MNQVNTNLIPFSLDDKEKPLWYPSRSMDEKPRSIRFPQSLWDRIDRDAERCKRSAVKHMEALLETYYRLSESVELNSEAMSEARKRIGSDEMNQLIRGAVEEARAKFHNAEQVEFPQKKLKVSDDRRDESEVSKPRKRGGQR